jgi:4-phospho-D-threonate 3-dehydrogenase / 4-phospho-D-erythronate 3-dehydrogenase
MTVPAIGITLGDPGGVGPEVVLKALSLKESLPEARYIVFGAPSVLLDARDRLGLSPDMTPWDGDIPPREPGLSFHPVRSSPSEFAGGRPSGANGQASFLSFEKAVGLAAKGILQGLVTGPISKTSWHLAGLEWKGHTEYLASLYPDAIMSFWSERMRVALLSHHLPLREALERVRKETLLDFFRTLDRCLERIDSGILEILVAGLNPHAGEEGLLGREEADEIRPAVEAGLREGLPLSGPYPPDTVFLKALGHPEKMVAALYHDQGLIGFKLEAFDTGVNATLGMPFIRTSPDHGTAFDIAGRGIADPRSMLEAIRLAVRLS